MKFANKSALELTQEQAEIKKKAKAILDKAAERKEDLSKDEQKRFDDYIKESNEFDAHIKRALEKEKIEKDLAASSLKEKNVQVQKKKEHQYSIARAIKLKLSGKPIDGLEAEMDQEHRSMHKEHIRFSDQGIVVPVNHLRYGMPSELQRALTVTASSATVPKDVYQMALDLNAVPVAEMMGAIVLNNLVGDVDLPRLEGAASQWGTEIAEITPGDSNTPGYTMQPKRLYTEYPISRTMLTQDDQNLEAIFRADINEKIKQSVDGAFFEGSGAGGEPTGIETQMESANKFATGAGTPATWLDILQLEQLVGASNALEGSLGYVTTHSQKSALKGTIKEDAGGVGDNQGFIWSGNEVNGYSAAATSVITAAENIYFGNFASVVIGNWGVMEIIMDEVTLKRFNQVALAINSYHDIGMRTPKSFSRLTVTP